MFIKRFSEFPGNWLSKSGVGAIPSNVDENDQTADVDSSSLNKGPAPLGRPVNCPRHFSEFENQCQVKLKIPVLRSMCLFTVLTDISFC